MPSSGGVPGTSHWEEAQGTAQDTLEGLCLSAGLGTTWSPPGGAGGGVWREGRLGVSVESDAPATRSQIKRKTTSTTTSTHFRRVAVELVPISSSLWVRDGEHPGEVASPSQGSTETHRTNNHAHSHSETN
ncbi:hypothetical protein ILYODFUR_018347 [Ilyodon furcidens]|uniref:Uncharacterized protein n=1 Tax=Ilyodon furcidens TaxID=33524 RepID=A0ABV0T0R4_9TELE